MIELTFQRQVEQFNGYWLANFNCEQELPYDFGFELGEHRLQLFSQKGRLCQFLSSSAIETPQTTLKLPQNTPSPSLDQDENTTWLIQASDLKMATAFHIAQRYPQQPKVIILHATESFPFPVKPAMIMFPEFPAEAIGSCPLLEDWDIPNRLCASEGLAGCFDGDLETLDQVWQPDPAWLRIKV